MDYPDSFDLKTDALDALNPPLPSEGAADGVR